MRSLVIAVCVISELYLEMYAKFVENFHKKTFVFEKSETFLGAKRIESKLDASDSSRVSTS